MKRWLWFFVGLVISTGVYFTIRYGLQPKAIPVMNTTTFENPEQIGAVIYKRLRQEVRGERLVILGQGAELGSAAAIWSGFMKTALADGIKIENIYVRDARMAPENVAAWKVESLPSTHADPSVWNDLRAHLHDDRLVVVIDDKHNSSHLEKDALVRELESMAEHPLLSITALPLTLRLEQIESFSQQCVNPAVAPQDAVQLVCAEARVSKAMLKKKVGEAQLAAVLERHGLKEYLLFVH